LLFGIEQRALLATIDLDFASEEAGTRPIRLRTANPVEQQIDHYESKGCEHD